MSERRGGAKGRRLGSSRRKQLQESSREAPATAPGPGEEPSWASEVVQRVQDFLREQDKEQAGFVTRSDMQIFQEEGFPCSTEELELIFDGLDAAGTGRLSTEDFTAGLRQFLSSQKTAREHRRRKTASRRVRLVLPNPTLEGVDNEERRHFAAFMDQLGTDNVSEEQEIWQLWVKLRQDEPQLLDNLEDFLAKMRHRIQEAKSKKEALEATLNKRVAEHDKEVQQLCEVLEQQIQQEQQRLEQKSVARSHQHVLELQQVLDSSEREVQRLVTAQMELERRCRSLRSTQQVTSTENRELEKSNRVLEDHLQHLHQQLEQTQGHLRTMRATVAWEHVEEPEDRAVAELPGEVPMSPQMSPGKSEKFRSEMRIRLGSQSSEGRAKSTHQVVWEMLPAEINISGAPVRASSVEEDPFPESLKEEHFSDQRSLLREMNDAIAALSQHLKAQAPSASPALADTACHPRDDAEPHMGQEAATAHGTISGVLQETLSGQTSHDLLEGDLKEGPATAEFCAPDVTQAGASVGSGNHTAQEPGAEQGEEAQRMLFLQGKGAGVKETVLKVAEYLEESREAGEQALREVEGARWMQEKTGWEKAQPLGEAEEARIGQGESLETDLWPPDAGQAGLAVGQCLAMEELQPGTTPGEHVQVLGMALQEWADPEKLGIELGEHLEPEPPPRGEVQMGAAHGDGVTPEVTVAPGSGMLEEEPQPQGEPSGADVLPARDEHGRAGSEEEKETQPREAELQLKGEFGTGDTGSGGSSGAEVPLAAAVPPLNVQEGGMGADVELLEVRSSETDWQLLAEVEVDLQDSREAGSPGTEQGRSMDPDVQPLEERDEPELGLGEEVRSAEVHSEGPSPAETVAGNPDLCGLFPVKSEALEAEDTQVDVQLWGSLSPGALWGVEGGRALQLKEEKDEAQGQGEPGLPQEPVLDPQASGVRQGEQVGGGAQPQEEAEILGTLEIQSPGANVQLLTEVDELTSIPGGSTEADVQPPRETDSLETEQGGSMDPDMQPLDEVDEAELVEMVEAKESWTDTQLCGGASPETPEGEEHRAATEVRDEAEDGRQGQSECGLPQEPVPQPYGVTTVQGKGAETGMQPWEEAGILDMVKDLSTGTNVQLIAEEDELKLAPGGSTEADLQLLGEAGSPGAEQGGSVDPEVQPLDQVSKAEFLETEAEDAQADVQLHGGLSSGAPWGGEGGTAIQIEEKKDEAQGQSEPGLPKETMLEPHGKAVGQGEEAGAGVQTWEKAESMDTTEDQSTDAKMQLLTEVDELKSASGESTEADLQLWGEAGSLGTEQGGSVAPEVQPLDQANTAEVVEMVETDDFWIDTQLSGDSSPKTPQQEGGHAAMELGDEAESGGQAQCEHGLAQEPVLDTLEGQSTGANVHMVVEEDELKLAPGGSTEADLQFLGEVGPPGAEQGGSVDPEVQPLDQVDEQDLVEMEAEDAQADVELRGGLSSGAPWEGEGETTFQFKEKDGVEEQGECELSHEPMVDPHGAAVRQREEAGAGVQTWEEIESMDTTEDQSTDAKMQLLTEVDELTSIPGGSTEADVQPPRETDSLETEQGGSMDPDMQPLDEVDKAELVEMVEAKESWTDTQLCGGASPETPEGEEHRAATEVRDEAEDGRQGQGECGLPQEPVLDPQGAVSGQGAEAGAGVLQEEAESLDTLEDLSTGANVQLFAEEDELNSAPGGGTEADLAPLGAAGRREGEQSLSPGLGAGLCAAHTMDMWEAAPGVHVSPPAEATSYSEPVTAAEGPGLEAKLGEAPTGPDGQIPEDTQTLELLQGERAAAEGRPLDGAQGLDVVQGERLEAGVRSVVETQGLGLNQGHEEGVSVLASPVSKVPLHMGTLKLEMMMQEDVLIPDVWQLSAAGQAAQSTLQEQVSAQGHSQQPKEKTPHVMEPEQAAARPAEPPKQEVPPESTLHMRAQPQEDTGNDQLGMTLGDSSLGDAANSCVQPQRQLWGEQSKDLNVGQQEKTQNDRKMSQEGDSSPGEPGAMAADRAGAAPRDCPKASLDPDHLYNVLFVGDSHVGKTSFLYRLHADSFTPNLTATVGLDYRIKNLVVDNKHFALRLWDSAGQERYHSMTKQFFRKADGVVLMYDITSQYSFSDVRYWLSCIQEAAEDGVAVLLLGNKTDCAAERQVPKNEGECLAKEHQLMFYECSAASGHNVLESMVSFIRLLKAREDELKNKAEEVPKAPQKKKSCCW